MFGIFKNKDKILRSIQDHTATMIKLSKYRHSLLKNSSPEDDPLIFAKMWASRALEYKTFEKAYKCSQKLGVTADPVDYLTELDSDAFDLYSITSRFGIEAEEESCAQVYRIRHGASFEEEMEKDLSRALTIVRNEVSIN